MWVCAPDAIEDVHILTAHTPLIPKSSDPCCCMESLLVAVTSECVTEGIGSQ